jgi:O-antigen/teichoic acid export membrane protein
VKSFSNLKKISIFLDGKLMVFTDIRSTYNLWLIVMSLVCTLGILWEGDILNLITPQNFHGASLVIPYVLLGYFFHGLYCFAVSPIFFYKRTILLPWFTGAAAAVNIGLNFLLIPYLGITGAALATTISMFSQAVIVYIVGRGLHAHGFDLLATSIVSLVLLIAFIGPLYVDDFVQSQSVRITSAIILFAFLYIFFKQDIISAFSSATRRQRPS